MNIKDTKEFEEKLDRDWDDNPTKYVRPYIPEMVIQDRTKLILAILDNDIERLEEKIVKPAPMSKDGVTRLDEAFDIGYNSFIENLISYKKSQRELINKQN